MVVSPSHDWIPQGEGYGRTHISSPTPKPLMTTDYRFLPPRTDRKPGLVLESLKTGQETTRAPGYVWWPEDGRITHAAYNDNIEELGGNYKPQGTSNQVLTVLQLQTMWRVISTTPVPELGAVSLAASMGSKNAAVDVFALGFVMTLPFTKRNGVAASASFLVDIAEFVHVRHTDKGTLTGDLTNFIVAHIM